MNNTTLRESEDNLTSDSFDDDASEIESQGKDDSNASFELD